MKSFRPDRKEFSYMGRIDFSLPESPVFIWAGSSVSFSFKGTDIAVDITNTVFSDKTHFGYFIDGIQYKTDLEKSPDKIRYTLAEGLENSVHSVVIFKRMDATHYFTLNSVVLNDGAELLPPEPKPAKRLECYGDSVSAGAVVEAVNYTAHADPENQDGRWDNAWFSYSMTAARLLNAQIHNNAQGGIAILDRTGYYEQPKTTGLVSTFDKLRYSPRAETSAWDFSSYIPHVVIIAVGQNDSFPNPDCLRDKAYYEKWTQSYMGIVKTLRSHYPKAAFILTTTVLCHEKIWDEAVEDIKKRLCDEKVYHFMYSRNGAATPGHPRISEQAEMAAELAAFIRTLPEEIWED
ncbi:MAG: hypothetical protein ACI4JX_04905 [Oscillospiraceae bacterium]